MSYYMTTLQDRETVFHYCAEEGNIDVLIGTKMVAKGHHFAGLAPVGVVDADLGLGGGDALAGRDETLAHALRALAARLLPRSLATTALARAALTATKRALARTTDPHGKTLFRALALATLLLATLLLTALFVLEQQGSEVVAHRILL